MNTIIVDDVRESRKATIRIALASQNAAFEFEEDNTHYINIGRSEHETVNISVTPRKTYLNLGKKDRYQRQS